MFRSFPLRAVALAAIVAACTPPATQKAAPAAEVVNVYSSRHYDADAKLFDDFTAATGIRVQTLEAPGEQLLQRLKAEGDKSPADVIITVDAGNLTRLTEEGLLQPASSATLEAAIPARLRDPEGRWFGVSKRARVIVYAKGRVQPEAVAAYEDLAKPAFKKRVCARSSTNVYNLSLLAGLIERSGAPAAGAWAKAVVGNFAREPQGSDTDQIKAIAAGVCDVAIVNHYYLVRLAKSADPADQTAAAAVGLVFPGQAGAGTHVNVSGVGVAAHAPNKANAVKLIEFLASPAAQDAFAKLNEEYPILAGAPLTPELNALGAFKEDETPLAVYGQRQREAQKLYDEAGWK
jgi:iron(III) transport system substrate-binding protein